MILQALEITNNTDPQNPVTELITETALAWTGELLDGKNPVIVSSVVEANYQDISSIENWAKWGHTVIGSAAGFMDWKCLRKEIKDLALSITSNDIGTNWSNLNSEEQKICCQYITNLIPSAKFIETYTDSNERTKISLNFDTKSQEARARRIEFMRLALMGAIGSVNALEFYDDAVREGRTEAYIGGIESKANDGKDGLFDLIDGTASTIYDINATGIQLGLRHRSYPITDGSGDTLGDKCDMLLGIANGLY